MIKPSKDIHGNRIHSENILDAIFVEENSNITLKDVLPGKLLLDIPIAITNADWVSDAGSGHSYYKEFAIPQVSSRDNPLYMLVSSTDTTITTDEILSYDKISGIETLEGKVRVYATTIPDTPITIILKGIPNRLFEI